MGGNGDVLCEGDEIQCENWIILDIFTIFHHDSLPFGIAIVKHEPVQPSRGYPMLKFRDSRDIHLASKEISWCPGPV